MNRSLPFATFLMTLLLVAGCSSSDSVKVVKVSPARPTQMTFQSMGMAQVKNSIMGACSANRLTIQTTTAEVTCFQKEFSNTRKRDIERLINDEFATNIQITTQFKLLEVGSDVSVSANTYAQYLAPVSVTSGPESRTKNLLDDISYDAMSSLLNQAAQSSRALK